MLKRIYNCEPDTVLLVGAVWAMFGAAVMAVLVPLT